jgi:hypothetical protein
MLYINELIDTYQSGIILGIKRLENSVTYWKRVENRVGGWLEDRFLLINVAKALYIDGCWIIYCLLIGCFLMIILQNLLQPQLPKYPSFTYAMLSRHIFLCICYRVLLSVSSEFGPGLNALIRDR